MIYLNMGCMCMCESELVGGFCRLHEVIIIFSPFYYYYPVLCAHTVCETLVFVQKYTGFVPDPVWVCVSPLSQFRPPPSIDPKRPPYIKPR